MNRLILAFSTALALAFSSVIFVELQPTDDALPPALPIPPTQPTQMVARDPQASASEQTQHRASWLQVVLARPLFEPSRRPPAEGRSVAASAPGLPRLAGVMVSATGRQAIFAGSGDKPVILSEGATLGGFTVQSIAAGQVTVTGPSGPQVLHPSFDPNPQTSVLAGAPRPFGGAGLFGSAPPPPIPAPMPGAPVGEANLANNLRGQMQLPIAGNVPRGTP